MLATCLAVLAAAAVSTAAPLQFRVDPVHSKVGFSIQHMGLAGVEGRFTDFQGTTLYAADDPELRWPFCKRLPVASRDR